jgi:hypothetical protein
MPFGPVGRLPRSRTSRAERRGSQVDLRERRAVEVEVTGSRLKAQGSGLSKSLELLADRLESERSALTLSPELEPTPCDSLTAMHTAHICDAVRPLGRYGGALASVRTDDLAAIPSRRSARNPGVDAARIDDVIYGVRTRRGRQSQRRPDGAAPG